MKRRTAKKRAARAERYWQRALKRNRGWHYLATCTALLPFLHPRTETASGTVAEETKR